jgi:hypothetical protein
LGNCLDHISQLDHHLLVAAYRSLVSIHKKADQPLPKNKNSKVNADADRRLRFLDCAVIKHLHELLLQFNDPNLPTFDTVRGMFTEGGELYPGSAFRDQNHIQIAVRNDACIKGAFFPPGLGRLV